MSVSLPRKYSVDFKVVLAGNAGPKQEFKKEIESARAWKALFGAAPMPQFQPTLETLVVIALGQRPSGGFKVEVKDVTREIGGVVGLLDTVRWRQVKRKGPATEALTYPFCAFVCAVPNSHPVFDP